MIDCTFNGILVELQRRFPEARIALREDRDPVRYVPPTTIWQRVKQVFTGPQTAPGYPYAEVAVIDYAGRLADVIEAVNELRAAGTDFRVKAFAGKPT